MNFSSKLNREKQEKTRLESWGIVAIILVFVVLAFSYSVFNPIHEATDELRHYRFVRVLATTGELPIQGEEACRSQSHHPPLFYALGAAATFWIDTGRDICDKPQENPFWAYRYWEVGRDNKNQYLHGSEERFPWSGEPLAAHLIRGINIVIGAAVVYISWKTARKIWPSQFGISLAVAGLVAFNPMFLYMSGAINNDVIAALSGSVVVYAITVLLKEPSRITWRWGYIFGALYGIALLSKFNLAAILVLIEAAFVTALFLNSTLVSSTDVRRNNWSVLKARVRNIRWDIWLSVNGTFIVTVVLIAGWWFVRNQLLYGEPTGFQQVTDLWGARDPFDSFGLAVSELPYAWTTLWGRFGFGQIPLPSAFYIFMKYVTIVGFIGALIGYIRRANFFQRIALILLSANVVIFFLVLFNYMLVSPAGPNGRFFFPAFTSLATIIVYGLSHWLFEISNLVGGVALEKRTTVKENRAENYTSIGLAGVVSIAMFFFALLALVNYLIPAYSRPPEIDAEASIPNPIDIHFDEFVTLVGYQLSQRQIHPGESIDIDLYWEVDATPPGDYLLFVHLIDSANTIVAQRDTHPGLGNFPSRLWRPSDSFVESLRLHIPETAYVPVEAELSIGLYAPNAYRLAVRDSDYQSLGDSFQLGTIVLSPGQGDYENPQDQNFNDQVKLVGYSYDRRVAKPGEVIVVTLAWQALVGLVDDYLVEVRMVADDGHENAWADKILAGGESQTSAWKAGTIMEDVHLMTIDENSPPGNYHVSIALRDRETDRLLPIIAEDGHIIESRLRLAQIRIVDN